MIKWLKKVDSIVLVLILTIFIGVVVITLRSKTYYVGYEIAKLKGQEKDLRAQNTDLNVEITAIQRNIRNSLLNEKDAQSRAKFIFPETTHVITEEDNNEKRN